MSKLLATGLMAALIASTTAVSTAEADHRRGHGFKGHHDGHHHRHRHDHRHGYLRDGKWIALGIIGGAALNALDDDDCYRTRRGRVVCD